MSPAALEYLIAVACAFTAPLVDKDDKIECMEKITNCAVGPDGKIDKKKARECVEKYKIKGVVEWK